MSFKQRANASAQSPIVAWILGFRARVGVRNSTQTYLHSSWGGLPRLVAQCVRPGVPPHLP